MAKDLLAREFPKLDSLTIFFPFFNDEGTVERQIRLAYLVGSKVTKDLEVIAIHGGESIDKTFQEIKRMKREFPSLIIIDKTDNWEGYAVIKYGFARASKSWVFYTDGDAQYDLKELTLLVEKQAQTKADVINGYKKRRGDGIVRFILGDLYAKFSRFIFELPIRDTDCDFRLIKKSVLDKINLVSSNASILGELIKKMEIVGAKFVEVPVSHYPRVYGKSNYTPWSLFKEKLIGDFVLYFKIKKMLDSVDKLRIVRFGLVGIVSIIVQTIFFNAFLIFSLFSPAWATIIADQFAIVLSFFLNNFYTFKDKKHTVIKEMFMPFLKFYLIVMVSTLAQALIVWIGTLFLNTIFWANVFFVIGLGVAFFWNYLSQKKLVWRKK